MEFEYFFKSEGLFEYVPPQKDTKMIHLPSVAIHRRIHSSGFCALWFMSPGGDNILFLALSLSELKFVYPNGAATPKAMIGTVVILSPECRDQPSESGTLKASIIYIFIYYSFTVYAE